MPRGDDELLDTWTASRLALAWPLAGPGQVIEQVGHRGSASGGRETASFRAGGPGLEHGSRLAPISSMTLPKIILVPTDFGAPSEAAIDQAIDYARVFGAEIVLMHAFELPIMGFPDGALVATAELSTRIMEGAQAGLERQLASRKGCGVTLRGIVKQGDPWHMVNETAAEVGAGLIVMGTHGRTGISRALIGSTAERVVRTASVPVLTVHLGDVRPAGDKIGTSQAEPRNGVGSRH
jgi:nucleotide-binding universal stress UspA family protein